MHAAEHRATDVPVRWHELSTADAYSRLDTTHEGLDAGQVERRRSQYGTNVLTEAPPRSAAAMFAAQFADFMVLILIGAAIVSGVIGDLTDTAVIAAIVVLNAVLGFVQEFRADRAMAAHDKPASLDSSIVQYANEVADALKVECHAVHCIPPSAHPPGYVTAQDRKRVERRMQVRMKQLIRCADAEMKAVHIVHGNVAESLPRFASRLPAQIVTMGIVSRRWMKRLAIGDTAESVIRGLSCDLLLIKPSSFRLRLGRTRNEAIVLPKAKGVRMAARKSRSG